jgi:DNA-binding response OmpR family regulator
VLRRPAPEKPAAPPSNGNGTPDGLPSPTPDPEASPRYRPGVVIAVGDLSIDSRSRQVKRAGEEIALTATEFDILWCLVQADGRVLSREEIQSLVWGPRHHGTLRTIDNFMMQLRTKLERDPAAPDHLLTVRGVGYRLAQ